MLAYLNSNFPEIDATLTSEFAESLPDMESSQAMLSGIAVLMALVGAFGMTNTILMSVLERTRELLEDGDSAAALNKHERSVCQAFIGAYNKRAAGSVSNIYTKLKTLVDAYQQQLQELRQKPDAEPPVDEEATNRWLVLAC